MVWLRTHWGTLLPLAILSLMGAAMLWLLPPEQTLGGVVRVIFLHGALVQVGLLVFAAAGVLGLVYLWRRDLESYAWLVAAQRTGLLVWVAYVLSSMLSTYLAWGQWIAWDEPRVRASASVLVLAVACWLLVWWVDNARFLGLANVVVAGVSWWLIKGATIFRHPFNPIGESSSATYRLIFAGLMVVVLLIAALVMRRLRPREPVHLA